MTAPVESENTLTRGIVQDGIRIFANIFYLAYERERFQIENADRAFAAVAGESAIEFGSERNSVYARRIRDIADRLAGIGVNHHDVRSPRNEEPTRIGVEREIVPSALAAEFVLPDNVVAAVSREYGGATEQYDQSSPESLHK